jgi:hypothetical protein
MPRYILPTKSWRGGGTGSYRLKLKESADGLNMESKIDNKIKFWRELKFKCFIKWRQEWLTKNIIQI